MWDDRQINQWTARNTSKFSWREKLRIIEIMLGDMHQELDTEEITYDSEETYEEMLTEVYEIVVDVLSLHDDEVAEMRQLAQMTPAQRRMHLQYG